MVEHFNNPLNFGNVYIIRNTMKGIKMNNSGSALGATKGGLKPSSPSIKDGEVSSSRGRRKERRCNMTFKWKTWLITLLMLVALLMYAQPAWGREGRGGGGGRGGGAEAASEAARQCGRFIRSGSFRGGSVNAGPGHLDMAVKAHFVAAQEAARQRVGCQPAEYEIQQRQLEPRR